MKDILPGSGSGIDAYFYDIINYGSSFYFLANKLISTDNEIWKTDGTTTGTMEVLDIFAGNTGSYANSFVLLPNDNLIFLATDATHNKELWSINLPGVNSIEKHDADEQMILFPNPSTSVITIKSTNQLGTVTVFNSLGETVYQNKTTANEITIDLSNQMAGIYFAQVHTSQGILNRKIIKQ